MHRLGLEPRSTTWKAVMLAIALPVHRIVSHLIKL